MLFGLVFLLILIFIIYVGISIGDYGITYIPVFILTLCLFAGYRICTDSHTSDNGWLPNIFFLGGHSILVMIFGLTDLYDYWGVYITLNFSISIATIICITASETNSKKKQTGYKHQIRR